uniref:ORF73 n=1 Tax=Nitrosopumilaceae spindle-shaped virus TaxID=3065433 RepID=A0AAT9J7F6_9VIRU
MHKRANELRDKIGYQAEDAKNSIEEKVYRSRHPEEEKEE